MGKRGIGLEVFWDELLVGEIGAEVAPESRWGGDQVTYNNHSSRLSP